MGLYFFISSLLTPLSFSATFIRLPIVVQPLPLFQVISIFLLNLVHSTVKDYPWVEIKWIIRFILGMAFQSCLYSLWLTEVATPISKMILYLDHCSIYHFLPVVFLRPPRIVIFDIWLNYHSYKNLLFSLLKMHIPSNNSFLLYQNIWFKLHFCHL